MTVRLVSRPTARWHHWPVPAETARAQRRSKCSPVQHLATLILPRRHLFSLYTSYTTSFKKRNWRDWMNFLQIQRWIFLFPFPLRIIKMELGVWLWTYMALSLNSLLGDRIHLSNYKSACLLDCNCNIDNSTSRVGIDGRFSCQQNPYVTNF